MAVRARERHEIALRIDHDLLDMPRRPFEQAAQQMRFSRSRIALHQQARGEKFLQVDADGRTIAVGAHIHANRHAARLAGAGASGQGVFRGSRRKRGFARWLNPQSRLRLSPWLHPLRSTISRTACSASPPASSTTSSAACSRGSRRGPRSVATPPTSPTNARRSASGSRTGLRRSVGRGGSSSRSRRCCSAG